LESLSSFGVVGLRESGCCEHGACVCGSVLMLGTGCTNGWYYVSVRRLFFGDCMRKKRIAIVAALTTLALIGAVLAASTALSGQRASNELDSYTRLSYPIRLTKVGDIPNEVVTGVPYTFQVVTENLNPSESYSIRIVFDVSQQMWFYPLMPTQINNVSVSEPPVSTPIVPPFNYSAFGQLTPDMVTLTFRGKTVDLAYNETQNALIGYSDAFTTDVGYHDSSTVTVQFNDAALAASAGSWTVSIWAIFA